MPGQLKGALCVSAADSTATVQWQSHRRCANSLTLAHNYPNKFRNVVAMLVTATPGWKHPRQQKEFRTNGDGFMPLVNTL